MDDICPIDELSQHEAEEIDIEENMVNHDECEDGPGEQQYRGDRCQ